MYAAETKTYKRQKRNFVMEEKVELASFKTKWAEYLTEEQENGEDIRPMLGLDSYDPAPKPYRIFSRSNVSKTLAKNKLTMNLMFEREVQRTRDKRDNLRAVLIDHQKWLSGIKSDINAYKTIGP